MIRPGDRSVRNVYVSGQPARRVYAGTGAGAEVVWEAGPPVVRIIPGGGVLGVRNQFRQACVTYGTTYEKVKKLPFHLDISQVTDISSIFSGCAALTEAPFLDTRHVTSVQSMFNGCAALTEAPFLDTTHMANTGYLFYRCTSLATVPDMDSSGITWANYMFSGCSSLADGNVRLIGKHPSVSTGNMITGSGLTREPFYDADGNPID